MDGDATGPSPGLARTYLPGEVIEFTYRNWRGKVRRRRVRVVEEWHGATEYHPEPQRLLKAVDLDEDAERDFAIADIVLD